MNNCKELLKDLGTLYNVLDRVEREPASERKTQLLKFISKEITAIHEEIFRECGR
jgi:hypothetical protein